MEVKILINSLLIILIIYIILDNIPYRYRFGVEKRIQNNRFMERYSCENSKEDQEDFSSKVGGTTLDFLND